MAGERMKRAVANVYSYASDRFYDKVVVNGAFRAFGGDLNDLVVEQGRRAIAVAAGRPILDMPVGTAYFVVRYASRHPGVVVGADIAEGMTREATRVAREAKVRNFQAVRADASRLPFADGSIRAIMCSNGLQVIPDAPAAVAELARVLAPGGTLFVSVVSLPLSTGLPPSAGARMPVMLRGVRDLRSLVEAARLTIVSERRARLAWLIEATR